MTVDPPEEAAPDNGDPEALRRRRELLDWFERNAERIRPVYPPEPEDPEPVDDSEDLERQDKKQDIELRRTYAYGALGGLAGALLLAQVMFAAYAHFGKHWDVPDAVMIAYLSATVVEVVGIVAIITRYLFPPRG